MSGTYIIFYAAILHLGWAGALLLTRGQQLATPVAALYQVIPNSLILGIALAVISICAAVAKIGYGESWKMLGALIPQQAVLMASALTSVHAITASQYADGVTRPRVFIFCDQLPSILGVVLHTMYMTVLWVRLLTRSADGK